MVKGVGYYNKEEQRIRKDNILVKKEDGFLLPSSGLGADAPESQLPPEASIVLAPQGILSLETIERAPIQFWDNGETSFQRYKLKVRLNIRGVKESPEFIAALTKDIRNFKRYLPEECRDELIEYAQEIRSGIKNKFGTYPYIGKFHLNTGSATSRKRNQTEPYTVAAVWYDSEEQGWSGILRLHDWYHKFDLFDNNVTAKQKAAGLKCSTLFINPKFDKRIWPKTWMQQQIEKKDANI